MATLPFAPLTDREVTDRYREQAMMAVGALTHWSEFTTPARGDAPAVAIAHAAECQEYLDAAIKRHP